MGWTVFHTCLKHPLLNFPGNFKQCTTELSTYCMVHCRCVWHYLVIIRQANSLVPNPFCISYMCCKNICMLGPKLRLANWSAQKPIFHLDQVQRGAWVNSKQPVFVLAGKLISVRWICYIEITVYNCHWYNNTDITYKYNNYTLTMHVQAELHQPFWHDVDNSGIDNYVHHVVLALTIRYTVSVWCHY